MGTGGAGSARIPRGKSPTDSFGSTPRPERGHLCTCPRHATLRSSAGTLNRGTMQRRATVVPVSSRFRFRGAATLRGETRRDRRSTRRSSFNPGGRGDLIPRTPGATRPTPRVQPVWRDRHYGSGPTSLGSACRRPHCCTVRRLCFPLGHPGMPRMGVRPSKGRGCGSRAGRRTERGQTRRRLSRDRVGLAGRTQRPTGGDH